MSSLATSAGPALRGGSPLKGLIAMAASMGLFVTNDTFVKLSMTEIPVGESLGLRSFVSGLLLLALVVANGDFRALPHVFRGRVLLRSSLDTFTTFLYVMALAVMPIASTTTIYMAAPLMTTALAVPMLGEKVSFRSWCAIAIGFLGAVIVTRPDPASFSLVAVLPLVAAFSGSVRDIATRGIGKEVPGPVVGVSATLVLCVGAGIAAIWETWRVPSVVVVIYLVAAALAFAGGTLALVYAFRSAPVASISPLRYLLVFGALVSGYFIFGDLPDVWTATGMALVVGAGLYAIHVEHMKSRHARKAASAATCGPALRLGEALPGPSRPAPACAPARD